MNFRPSKLELLSKLFEAAEARFSDNYLAQKPAADFLKSTFAFWLSMPLPEMVSIHPNLITIRYPNGTVVECNGEEFIVRTQHVVAGDAFATWRPSAKKDKNGVYAAWPMQETYILPRDLEKLQKKLSC